MRQHGLLRPLKASELSDGTFATLPSARRRPALAATTGPDGSQRTRNQPASGVVAAAGALDCASIETIAQVVVVSHAAALVSALDADADCRQIVLEKQLGETVVTEGTAPDWTWPSR